MTTFIKVDGRSVLAGVALLLVAGVLLFRPEMAADVIATGADALDAASNAVPGA
jgi:hypothetical protein